MQSHAAAAPPVKNSPTYSQNSKKPEELEKPERRKGKGKR
jgi:hypothetical protein